MTQTSIHVVKTTLALLLLNCLPFNLATAQTIISGTVIDQRTNEPLPGVEVRVLSNDTRTDAFGQFELNVGVTAGEDLLVNILIEGYQAYSKEVSTANGTRIDLGRIGLAASGSADPTVTDEFIPTITLSSDDLDGGGGAQNISGVLSASRDVFVSAAAFTFGSARFNIRGYDAKYTDVLINGMPVNDLETGGVFFNHWGGLNDVFRLRTNTIGLGASNFAYGGVGGASIIDTRASAQRKELRVGYASSNRTYTNRLMATYNTGMLESGWAFSFSASRRWAEEGYVEGTFYDAYSYFLSADRRLGDKATLNLTVFGAPIKRGKISGATQEAYDLTGSNFYNSNWGLQNGKKRNSRVQNIHQPIVILRNDWTLSEKLQLTTSLGYQTGRTGNTALDWYDGPDPRPNYYRKLPSYFEGDVADQITTLWQTDVNTRQINWDQIYQINYNSFATVNDANGIEGNTVTGLRSQYIVEDRRTDLSRLNANTVLEAFVNDHLTIQFGGQYQNQTTENYKLVDDLLGGDFYLNVDRFAEFDSSGIFVEHNLDVPNQVLEEGDRWGYDFDYEMRKFDLWTQANFRFPKVDFYVAGSYGQSNIWRFGNIANGKFPTTSAGKSAVVSFTELGAKGGITYKLNGRNYLLVNGAYQTQAPFARDVFSSPRTRNQVIDNPTEEKILSIEGGYLMRSPNLKIRAIGYFTQFKDQVFNRSLFLDRAIESPDGGTRGGFVNYIMSGINTQHAGVELAIEAKVTPALTASAVAAIGQYIYTNRPTATIYLDQLASKIDEHPVYIKEFNVAGGPNEVFTFGLNYNSPKYWFANINFNYFAGTWLDFFPERRTPEAISYTDNPEVVQEVVRPDSELWNSILDQERTPDAFTVDIFGGKSWKINDVFLYLNVGVNNILNKTDFRTGGYEQFRFDFETKDVDRFPNNYFYSFGRNYFVSLAFKL
ncbi:carboxypeptidase-like regulatory domain-containing protein [Lewinella sp. LCG006]|uniref:carboxypeptidase-like regulatory domain-containing protein n=1 Tax=Lewinella sp. LCG006 TaxID=3231911 RepID=UPI0034615892